MSSTTFSMRIDSDLKHQAETTYGALGQTLSSAINAFLTRSVLVGGFPFEMRLSESQRETLAAKLEADEMLAHPERYDFMDVEDAIAELNR